MSFQSPPGRTWLAIICAAILLAIVVLLWSGAFRRTTGSALVGGDATWYCNADPHWRISRCPRGHGPDEYIAAINPAIVAWPKGTHVIVRYGSRKVAVTIVDTCAAPCSVLIDLSRIAFSKLADPNAGRISVTVVAGSLALPPTDTIPRTPADLRMMLEVRGDELYR